MKTQEQSMQEIISRLGELFRDRSIGLYPVRNDNGGDSYRCPSCSAEQKTLGYAWGQEPLDSVEHDGRCDLNLLFKLYQEHEDKYPPEETTEEEPK